MRGDLRAARVEAYNLVRLDMGEILRYAVGDARALYDDCRDAELDILWDSMVDGCVLKLSEDEIARAKGELIGMGCYDGKQLTAYGRLVAQMADILGLYADRLEVSY